MGTEEKSRPSSGGLGGQGRGVRGLYRGYSPLRETPREYFECLEDSQGCQDELFLLPERVLDMDSYTLREDLASRCAANPCSHDAFTSG